MRRRLLESIGVAAVMVLLKLAPVTAEEQTPGAPGTEGATAKAGPASKTPWGEPDLQGI